MSRRPGLSSIGTRRWGRIRLGVLLRDGYRCHYCGQLASTVDHKVRRQHGGDDSLGNLVACCKDCQYEKRRPVFGPGKRAETSAVAVSLPKGRDRAAVLLGGSYGPDSG
jgi:5-methylcytosine-specific restriction endonuclease McrA